MQTDNDYGAAAAPQVVLPAALPGGGDTRPRIAFAHLAKTGRTPHQESSPSKPNSFIRHYKEINFDTLKQRHDNFSFAKTLQSKFTTHNTIHFENFQKGADMVLFPKHSPNNSNNRSASHRAMAQTF